MKENLLQFLAQLDGPLRSIGNAAERLLSVETEITEEDTVFLISRRPKIAPQAYACVLHQGLTYDSINRYLRNSLPSKCETLCCQSHIVRCSGS
jgi:hypothetical protein